MSVHSEKTREQLIDEIELLRKELAFANSELNKLRGDKPIHGNHAISHQTDWKECSALHSSESFANPDLHTAETERLNTLMNVVLNNVPVYLFMKDANDDFRYLYWNQTFTDFSGISYLDVVGKTDYEIFQNKVDMDRFREDDIRTVKEGRIEFIERYYTKRNDERIVKTIKTLVRNGKEAYIIGMCWDITDIKKTEDELIASRIKAEESDKLKTAFLANMSHEIRTPLNAIVGFSKLNIDTCDDTERALYADIIEKNSDMLLNLFNDILDLSALEADTMDFAISTVKMNEVCHQLYGQYVGTMPAGVALVMDPMDEHLSIEGDWRRILQIGNHLLNNAIKFTRSGTINFGFHQKGDMVLFYVKDTGIGIDPKQGKTIFQRFDKVDSFVQGTGLGLPICRMLVEKMGGKIWLRSVYGKGSTFYFTLPLKVNVLSHSRVLLPV